MEQFLNFHTHNFPLSTDEKSIYNLLIQDISHYADVKSQWISVGIHPWYAEINDWEKQLDEVERLALLPQVVAIGECGLDRGIALPLEKQLLIFDAQVKLAERVQKPIIIHCVRAFNELIRWKKQIKSTVPLIIHGFNNKPQIAQQLLAHGFYLSLGTSLLQLGSNASKALEIFPLDRLFLENDDSKTPILEIYEIAALVLGTSALALKNQIWQNFDRLLTMQRRP